MTESYSVPQSNFLQGTVLILSAICQILTVCIISTNISRYSEERLYVFVGILILSCIIMIIWIIAFTGAVNENYHLIYFVLVMWVLIALFWCFFLIGCITPTRCSESLWLIENKDRAMYKAKLETEYYYHEYHYPVFDTFPKKFNKETEFEHKEYEDIPYANQREPMVEFVKYYVPWRTQLGAIRYTTSFLSVLGKDSSCYMYHVEKFRSRKLNAVIVCGCRNKPSGRATYSQYPKMGDKILFYIKPTDAAAQKLKSPPPSLAFNVNSTHTVKKIKSTYCQYLNVSVEDVFLSYKGNIVHDYETLNSLNVKSKDFIDLHFEQ